eukprot:TRINITY_DN5298_c0_g1_i1.p1 TRINITY_DN5298_c0_g1~~TRINITY_DN5298_c0_g1_i1.p1  ORF type:complete len:574 (-),score=162.84 TRINITY_DN5298_c0_g1_i1:194-1885(-)
MMRLRPVFTQSARFVYNSPRATIGHFGQPTPYNEPLLDYKIGSPERKALAEACKKYRNGCVDIPCVIGGKEIRSGATAQQLFCSTNKKAVAIYHKADAKLAALAVEEAMKAKKSWEQLPFEHRAAIFYRAADLLSTKYRADVCAAMMLGSGKTVWQAEIDAAVESIDFLRINCFYAKQIYDVQPMFHSKYTWNRTEYRPLEGFVFAVSPFNFAAIGTNLSTQPAVMGNTVLWKPASTAVLANWVTFQALREAGIPDGVINFIPGPGSKMSPPILLNKNLAAVHFTGSTNTFNTVWKTIANNVANYRSYPRLVGETGGKNFHFVHESARNQLPNVVSQTIRAAFEYQGQKCSACSRMYVPSNLWPQIKEMFVEEIGKIKMGQPDDFSTFMTAVIDKDSFDNIKGYIEKAKNAGGEILVGGKCDDSEGYFVEPTIIVSKDPKSVTMQEEIFGPVLTVHVYDENKYSEALTLCNETSPYALTGSIFATDRYALEYAASVLRDAAGNFYINDKCTGAVVGQQPFGGARGSGTNDKAGSAQCLSRWVSPRCIKESFLPISDWKYPHMA